MFDPNYFSKDIFEFLRLLSTNDVRYVVVGGEAVIYYGHARLTGDIDIYYDISEINVNKLWKVLLDFWENDIPDLENIDELKKSGVIVQFGLSPNRIDLLNMIDGVGFSEVWENRKIEKILINEQNTFEINFIGFNELIKNKEKSGRTKDLIDLNFLKSILK